MGAETMRMRGLTVAAVTASALAMPSAAQESGHASDRALAPLVACRQSPDSRARAACYDAALDALQGAVAARRVVILDREQVAQDRAARFGFAAPDRRPAPVPRKAAPPVVPEPAEVVSTVVAASQSGYDQWSIRIATGATWRTIESGIDEAPKPGTPIRIRKAAMGSFLLKVGKYGHAVRAVRIG